MAISEVYNMDCMEGIKLLDDKSIDLVIIDPPYRLNISKVKPFGKNVTSLFLLPVEKAKDNKLSKGIITNKQKRASNIKLMPFNTRSLVGFFINFLKCLFLTVIKGLFILPKTSM